MDNSQWLFNQEAGINGHNNNHHNACDGIDLTLRLGLPFPDCDQNPVHSLGQDHVNPACMAPNHIANVGFPGPRTQQRINQLGMVNQGTMVQGQQGFNGTQYAWSSNEMASKINHMNYANAFKQFSGPSLGFPSYNTSCYNNFATTCCRCRHHRHQLPAPRPVPANNYRLLDVPPTTTGPRSHQQELGTVSGSRTVKQNKRGRRRQRGGNNNDPNKRCTNNNCSTNDTPMWRRGPLGPKTLCNACGIKYRKEEEKRREREAESKGRQSNPNG